MRDVLTMNKENKERLRELDLMFNACGALKYVKTKVNNKYNLKNDSFLYVLYTKDNDGTNQDNIACFISVAKSTAGRVIDDLVERELLVRKQDPNNKRANNINITSKGNALIQDVCLFYNEWELQINDSHDDI